jgi:hypothetical protein
VAFVFGDPTTTLHCATPPGAVSSLSMSIRITGYVRAAFNCTQATAVGRAWQTRFLARQSWATLVVNGRTYHCIAVAQNYACAGAGTLVRFGRPATPPR